MSPPHAHGQRSVHCRGSVTKQRSVINAGAVLALTIALAGCAVPSHGVRPASDSQQVVASGERRRAEAAAKHSRMAAAALPMLGQPYRFGGSAPGGFDCSGLVQYAANGAGLRLPRTAMEQSRSGTQVARGEIQAGDLVFMHLARKELHVGIALDGELFLHAPSTGGFVRIDHLTANPYSFGYLYARRIAAAP